MLTSINPQCCDTKAVWLWSSSRTSWESFILSGVCNTILLLYVTDPHLHFVIKVREYLWIFRKWDVGVWTGSSWLRIGTGGGHLWLRLWTFAFHKMRGISWKPFSFSRALRKCVPCVGHLHIFLRTIRHFLPNTHTHTHVLYIPLQSSNHSVRMNIDSDF